MVDFEGNPSGRKMLVNDNMKIDHSWATMVAKFVNEMDYHMGGSESDDRLMQNVNLTTGMETEYAKEANDKNVKVRSKTHDNEEDFSVSLDTYGELHSVLDMNKPKFGYAPLMPEDLDFPND